MRRSSVVAAIAIGLGIAGTAQAVPVVYDFTGSGNLSAYTGVETDYGVTPSTSFTGTVTIDVNPAASPTVSGTTTYAYDGWVTSDFVIKWGSTTFAPGPLAGQTYSDEFASVVNDYAAYDQLVNDEQYRTSGSLEGTVQYGQLIRNTTDLSWLSDSSFPTTLGLAPGGTNEINFANISYAYNSVTRTYDYSGFWGDISLTSFSLRAAAVPEPATVALLGLGLAVVGCVRRRRGWAARC